MSKVPVECRFLDCAQIRSCETKEQIDVFSAKITTDFSNPAGTINGGFLIALLVRIGQLSINAHARPYPHVLSSTVHYARAVSLGACRVEVHTVKCGQSLANLRVTLFQDGVQFLEMLAVYANLENMSDGIHYLSKLGSRPAVIYAADVWPVFEQFHIIGVPSTNM
eukprot:298126_1